MCFTVPIAGRALAGQAPLRLPAELQCNVVSMREQVCSSEEVHCRSGRSTAGDGGTSDTRTTPGCIFPLKGNI